MSVWTNELILEQAILSVIPARAAAFEVAMREAHAIIRTMDGYEGHELYKCIDGDCTSQYLLLIRWRRLEDHTVGFRNSPQHDEWKRLLSPFYSAPSAVKHFQEVTKGAPAKTV
jgi:heme-degrading monooxygenase HmoA